MPLSTRNHVMELEITNDHIEQFPRVDKTTELGYKG